ncbi:MAG: hypothetical protein ACP5OG_00375 [Candidatus Nanoarchaeia archaeon]
MRKKRIIYDTKAWIRIVEALFAILIVAGGLFLVMSRQAEKKDLGDEINLKQRQILETISKENRLRNAVITNDSATIDEAVRLMIPDTWNYKIKICALSEICSLGQYIEKDVYVSEVVIATNITNYSPKKLRLFVWSL